jgi:hypothetical protein
VEEGEVALLPGVAEATLAAAGDYFWALSQHSLEALECPDLPERYWFGDGQNARIPFMT